MNETYVTFTGWVGSEVSLADLGGGHQLASFRVGSTPRRYQNGQWEDGPTTWYTVKAWRRLAEHVHASVRQRDPVLVHGRLVADTWTREDGSVSTRQVVVATSVGHDLSRGTSRFTKAARAEGPGGGQDADAAPPEPAAALPAGPPQPGPATLRGTPGP